MGNGNGNGNENGNENGNDNGNGMMVLPPGWSKGFSKSQNKTYYYHVDSKHTQWHFPTASEVADPLKAIERAKHNRAKEAAAVRRTKKRTSTDDQQQQQQQQQHGSATTYCFK